VKEQGQLAKKEEIVELPFDTVERMTKQAYFEMPWTYVNVTMKSTITEILLFLDVQNSFPISGFPRSLFNDEKQSTSKADISKRLKVLFTNLAFSLLAPRQPIVSNSNRWAGSSIRSKSTRQSWKAPNLGDINPPDPMVSLSAPPRRPPKSPNRNPEATDLPPSPQKESEVRISALRPTISEPTSPPRGAAAYLRSAFRALARPVRAMPSSKPSGFLSVPAELEGSVVDDYQIDANENAVYQRWISGLQQAGGGEGDEATKPVVGLFEMEGDLVYPVEVSTTSL
jgi:hypothetical protein